MSRLPAFGAQWVKDYTLERSRYLLGEIWSKFSGAIPSPVQNLTLDQQKRDRATERLKELREELKAMARTTPIMLD
jgi:hypothetical protein